MRAIKSVWVFFLAVILCTVSLYAAEPELDDWASAGNSSPGGPEARVFSDFFLAGMYDPGESRSAALPNSFFIGGSFLDSAPGSEIIFISSSGIGITHLRGTLTVTCPNGFTFTNFAAGAFIPAGQVIEGTPPYPGTPDPDNGMYVLSNGEGGLTVNNPVFGDTWWTVTVTSNANAREGFRVTVYQRVRMIGNNVYGQNWRFEPDTGTVTINGNSSFGWRWDFANAANIYFDLADVKHAVFGENMTNLGWNVARFADCVNLQSVTFKNPNPPSNFASMFATAFSNTPNLTTIYVPPGAKAAFAAYPHLAPFNIVEFGSFDIPPTGVPDIAVAMAAMLVLFAVSAASWCFVLRQRRKV